MTLRLQNMMLAMLLALTTLFVGFGTLSQNPTSGGYQLFERAASGISADIQLASLGNFAPPLETVSEYANAPNKADDVAHVPSGPDYSPTNIGGREYSSHALQRMNERGLTPSVVENTVDDAFLVGQGNRPNTLVYYDPTNRVQVVTNFNGDVVTVIPGNAPKPGALAPLGD